jgi:hypothetical protein
VASCGDDSQTNGAGTSPGPDPTLPLASTTAVVEPTLTTVDEPTSTQPEAIVIREMTEAEWQRYDEIEGNGPMTCPRPNMEAGGANWDYGGDTSQDPSGRQPQDALLDAVTDLNENYVDEVTNMGLDVPADGLLPLAGWVGLTHADDSTVYFVYPESEWEHIVLVGGDPSTGVWRHHKAWNCVTLP